MSGNWQGAASLPGRLRLCTKSLFFDPDDVRVPIVRWVGGGGGRKGVCVCVGWGVTE